MADETADLAGGVAKLTEAVRELRDREVAGELARLREEIAGLRDAKAPACGCHGHCHCWHPMIHWYPAPGAAAYPNYVVTTGTNTLGWDSTAGCAGGSTAMNYTLPGSN